MGTATFAALVAWVIAHGYFLFFLANLLEGPLVTAAAGVAAALGYYSLPIIILVSIAGDLVPDTIYYALGYFAGRKLIKRYGKYIGISQERIEKIENFLKRHVTATVLAVKLSPIVAVPGIIVIGSARVPVKKFAILCLIITVPRSLLFALLGYYSGRAYERLSAIVTNSQLILFGTVIFLFLVYLGYKKLSAYITKKLEHNKNIPLT